MSKETGGAAFPHDVEERYQDCYGESHMSEGSEPGMTLRDYFAAKAAGGLVGNVGQINVRNGESYATEIATMAYTLADAMLKERNK